MATPLLAHSLWEFGIAWALINGVMSGVFALSFAVLSQTASEQERGRVMSLSYLPVNIGTFLGPALGSLITSRNVFIVFPAAAIFTAFGVAFLVWARMQKGPIE